MNLASQSLSTPNSRLLTACTAVAVTRAILGRVSRGGGGAPWAQMSLLTRVEQDAGGLYFVRVPNLRGDRGLELFCALVLDGGAGAKLAGATQTAIYEGAG